MTLPPSLEKYIFLVPVAVVLGALGLVWYAALLRRRKLEELASSMGLLFSEAGPDAGFLEGTGLEIFNTGRSRRARNLIKMQVQSGNISVFDYSYTTGSGKNRQTLAFTLALIETAGLQLPNFDLKPESLMYKIGEFIGFKDIDLPAFPVFSDKYRLTGADEAAVHMFFTPDRAAWFERNLGLRVQGSLGHVVVFKREGRLPVEAWQGFIEEVKTFASEVLK
ncbi:MAG: hypothetical protein HY952_02555 [Elusimicrobia bacterium]|nr:hypothetical protein [Elusimicrobiota bacterium]